MDNNWIVENLTNAFGVWNSKMTEMWSLLTESPQTFKGGTIWQTIVTINGGMQAIGYGLLVLFFAIGIFRSASGFRDFQRPEHLLRHFIYFVLAKLGITYGMDLLVDVFDVCSGIVATAAGSIGGLTGASVALPQEIADAIPCNYAKCCKHLENCIDKGVFGENAYLDMRTGTLVVRGAPPAPQPAPAAAPKAQPGEAKAEDNYAQILNQLRALNDAIPGEEMSDKISRLEAVSAKIFAQAKQNPDKLPQMRKFMDYYLPTALKLLKTYAELDAQGVEGENIRESKQRIEQVMDTLVTAFEAQLDRLFEDDALDVSTDIDVMENMLRADGLTGNTGNSPKLQL